jgi:hypothetical protein
MRRVHDERSWTRSPSIRTRSRTAEILPNLSCGENGTIRVCCQLWVQEVGRYSGYTGRDANIVTEAAYDPNRPFDEVLSCIRENHNFSQRPDCPTGGSGVRLAIGPAARPRSTWPAGGTLTDRMAQFGEDLHVSGLWSRILKVPSQRVVRANNDGRAKCGATIEVRTTIKEEPEPLFNCLYRLECCRISQLPIASPVV